jgi:CheY-like chemotaxis protein
MIRLLHVDDSRDDLEITKFNLQKLDDTLSIEFALSAEQALEKMREGKFDCVISDHQMPKMKGTQFLKTIRERGNETPFILLTGQGSDEVAREALEIGADDYFPKGEGLVHYLRLVTSIKRIVEARRRLSRQRGVDRIATRILKTLPGLIFIIDKRHNIIVSSLHHPKLALEEEKAPITRKCYQARFNRDSPCEECIGLEVFETGKSKRTVVKDPVDGKYKEVNVFPIFETSGKTNLVMVQVINISERLN